MNRLTDEVFGFKGSTPPEVPPDFPFPPPPQAPKQPADPVPMIYVNERERVEYAVREYEDMDARQMERQLNELGRDGWWLTGAIPRKEGFLIILCRTVKD